MNSLLDFLQGASNSAAGAVSAPVDGIAWLLRKAGIPVPDAPLGGSDWMAQRGLTAEPQNKLLGLLGEAAGMSAPIAAAAKAPQIAGGLLQMGENLAAPAEAYSRGFAGRQRGIFMGDLSKTWNKEAAERAAAMERAGADPRAIWQETGTFRGVDGKWRQEIDDSGARMSGALPDNWVSEAYKRGGIDEVKRLKDYKPPYLQEGTREVGDVFSHRQLTEAYPWATQHRNYRLDASNHVIGEGSYAPHRNLVTLSRADEPTARGAMLHELQHAVQEAQGFARGGSPGQMPMILDDLASGAERQARSLFDMAKRNDPLNPGDIVKPGKWDRAMKKEQEAMRLRALLNRIDEFGDGYLHDAYRSLAGEAEARAVQKRMGMSAPERRQTFPFDSYDVPINQLLVR